MVKRCTEENRHVYHKLEPGVMSKWLTIAVAALFAVVIVGGMISAVFK